MNTEREIFCGALELERTAERAEFLDEACGGRPELRQRVQALLQADAGPATFLDEADSRVAEGPGSRIGQYRLRERLGEGGFGIVYLADQERPVRREVALKIIKLGMDTRAVVARFEAERQALAWMEHPNIARVFDGGATATGRPYFVMERVRGVPITVFCNDHRLAVADRLRLFLQVCRAVQHAHQKGIIHRDLKPSNILVSLEDDRPLAKVIDFGIAKATRAPLTDAVMETQYHVFVGTPAYMSPEQITGREVDTRSDIYSLGALLFELLTDQLPIETRSIPPQNYLSLQRAIIDREPSAPSKAFAALDANDAANISSNRRCLSGRLVSELRGDLDSIILHCLEKEPSRRYPTCEDLAHDIESYLAYEPVAARPAGRAYRAGKFLRRHRASVVVVVTALLLLAILGTYHARRLTAERDRARLEAVKAAKISELLSDVLISGDPFRSPDPHGPLEASVARLRREFSAQPDVRAEILNAVGRVYLRRGQHDAAEPILREALAAARALKAPDLRLAFALVQWGVFLRERGDYVQSAAQLEEALQQRKQLLGLDHNDVAIVMVELSRTQASLDRLDVAEPLSREALAIRRRVLGPEHREIATSLGDVASLLWQQGKLDESESYFRASLAMHQKTVGPDHPNSALAMTNLAALRMDQGRLAEAKALLDEATPMLQRAFGDGHWRTARVFGLLGAVARREGRMETAERLLDLALPRARAALGAGGTLVISLEIERARVHVDRSEASAAEGLLREALDAQRRSAPENSWRVAEIKSVLASALEKEGRLAEAAMLSREAATGLPDQPGPQGRETKANRARLTALMSELAGTGASQGAPLVHR